MAETAHRRFLELLGWQGAELEAFLPGVDERRGVPAPFGRRRGLRGGRVAAAVLGHVPGGDAQVHRRRHPRGGRPGAHGRLPGGRRRRNLRHDAVLRRLRGRQPRGGEGPGACVLPYFIVATVWTAFFGRELDMQTTGSGMDPACQHCALNCLRADSEIKKMFPAPTVIWNWGLQCDEAPKTDEMLARLEGREWDNVLTIIPHDAPLGMDESEDDERVAYMAEEMRCSQRQASQRTGRGRDGRRPAPGRCQEQLDYMYRLEKLTDLVMNADPMPMMGNDLALFTICLECCFDTGHGYLNDALDTAIRDVERRIAGGKGVLPKGAPKLACHFSPLNVPWIEKAFRDNGVNLTLGRMFPSAGQLVKCVRPGRDAYLSAASMCLEAPNNVNMLDEVRMTCEQLTKYPVDGAPLWLLRFRPLDRRAGKDHDPRGRGAHGHTAFLP